MYSILYVDDEPDLLQVSKIYLEHTGQFQVDTVTSASEALSLIEINRYEAIISDYQMPGMNGIEFLKQVRGSGISIPFIMFTGRGREEIAIQALNEGANFYLQKGGDPAAQYTELINNIRISIEHHDAMGALRESERKYRDVIENANEAIVIAQDGKLAFVNPRAVEIIEATRDVILSRPFTDFVHPDDRQMLIDRYQQRLQGDDVPQNYDFRLATPGGRTIWIQLSAVCIMWDGRPATLNFLTDITRRVNVEEELKNTQAGLEARVKERTADLYSANLQLKNEIRERERLSSAWQESEEKFRRIVETLDDIYFRLDNQGIIDDISPSCRKLLGWMPCELIGTSSQNLCLDPEDVKTFISQIQHNGAVTDFELTLKHKDCRTVPVSVTMHILYDREGCTLGLEGTVRDITERKHTERALMHAANNLLILFNSIDEMVFVLDIHGRILYVNDTVKKKMLYEENELLGIDVLLLHVVERRDEALHIVRGMIEGTVDACPVPLIAKDGTIIEVETKVTRGTWNGQEVLIGVSRDVTERKQSERLLIKSEEMLNLAISGSGAALWDWNVQTGETVYNERWAEIVGYTIEELGPDDTWTRLMHPDDVRISRELLRLHFEGELPDYECEVRMRHKDGHWVWVLSHGRVTQWSGDGKPLRMTGTNFDISRRKALEQEIEFHEQELMQHSANLYREVAERRRLEDDVKNLNLELEEKVRERTEELAVTLRKLQDENTERKHMEDLVRLANRNLALMNDVSYQDIQNKITALRGFVMISLKNSTDEKQQEVFKNEEKILTGIHNLIKNTRDYQKLGADKLQWLEVEKAVRMSGLPIGSRVSLETDLKGIFIYSDPQVARVFSLLVNNTVVHGKKATRISISTRVNPAGVTILYEDDGTGIPAEEKTRIFDRVVAGEGKFGLFYVHESLALSGMGIMETGVPGEGARFEITVPNGLFRFSTS